MNVDLAKQLDLAIYELPDTFWWYQPGAIAGMFVFVLSAAFAYSWYRHRKKRRAAVKIPDQLRELLRIGMAQVREAKLTASDMLILLTSVLKSYTAWRCEYDAVHAMTDTQWLTYIEHQENFKDVFAACQDIVQKMSASKFNYKHISIEELQRLVDQVLAVIAATLPKTSSTAG